MFPSQSPTHASSFTFRAFLNLDPQLGKPVLQPSLSGPMHELFVRVLRGLSSAKVTKPGQFRNADGDGCSVRCSYKVRRTVYCLCIPHSPAICSIPALLLCVCTAKPQCVAVAG